MHACGCCARELLISAFRPPPPPTACRGVRLSCSVTHPLCFFVPEQRDQIFSPTPTQQVETKGNKRTNTLPAYISNTTKIIQKKRAHKHSTVRTQIFPIRQKNHPYLNVKRNNRTKALISNVQVPHTHTPYDHALFIISIISQCCDLDRVVTTRR